MDPSDSDLSQEQTDKLLTFQELTSIENITVCRDILQRHNWDLEVAVQEQLNITEGRPTLYASETERNNRLPALVNEIHNQQVFSTPSLFATVWTPRWLPRPIAFTVSYLFRFCYDIFSSIVRVAYSLFYEDPRRQLTDPIVDVANFISYFNDTYGLNHPAFYQGSYGQALTEAKQELRFLLVYLHSENDKDCEEFCRITLTNSEVTEYINSNNIVCWGCSTSSGEGYKVSEIMQPSNYPFVAVIVLRENHKMTIVGRLEGPFDATEFKRRLTMVVSVNEHSLSIHRAERIERSFNQSLRAQQDEAYLESLKADQEKERKKEELKQKEREEEMRLKQLREEEEEKRNSIRKLKMTRLSMVREEPPLNQPDSVRIVFKMPNAQRLERRFLSSHTINDVYNFIFCHPDSPDYFELATNFPKKIVCSNIDEGTDVSLKEAGLCKGEVLFVNDLEK